MIKVIAKHFIREDKINEFLESANKLVEASLKEEGCINYELYQDINDSDVVTIIEEWKDKTELDKHMDSEHFKSIVPKLGELSRKEGDINIYKKL